MKPKHRVSMSIAGKKMASYPHKLIGFARPRKTCAAFSQTLDKENKRFLKSYRMKSMASPPWSLHGGASTGCGRSRGVRRAGGCQGRGDAACRMDSRAALSRWPHTCHLDLHPYGLGGPAWGRTTNLQPGHLGWTCLWLFHRFTLCQIEPTVHSIKSGRLNWNVIGE